VLSGYRGADRPYREEGGVVLAGGFGADTSEALADIGAGAASICFTWRK
jgi:hypothetical protein